MTDRPDPEPVAAEPLTAAIDAAIEALREQFNHAHGNDWSAADADRNTADAAILNANIAALDAARSAPPITATAREALTRILERVARAEQFPQTYTVLPEDRTQPGMRMNDDGTVYLEHYYGATFGQDDVDFALAALPVRGPTGIDPKPIFPYTCRKHPFCELCLDGLRCPNDHPAR